ncbi:hypothetical protein BLA29_015292, partial [Euroglyphus maynei]
RGPLRCWQLAWNRIAQSPSRVIIALSIIIALFGSQYAIQVSNLSHPRPSPQFYYGSSLPA